MGRGCDKDDLSGRAAADPQTSGDYHPSHGNPSGILQQEQGQSSAGPEDAGPPGFPSIKELEELNRQIHQDAGTPERFKLDQPSPLESSLERARSAYLDSSEGVIQTAALLAHGIAQAQSFVDGNRRTAYFATLAFLRANGYGDLTPIDGDDHTVARYLNQVVENQGNPPGAEKFARLFTRRLRKRRGQGKTEGINEAKR